MKKEHKITIGVVGLTGIGGIDKPIAYESAASEDDRIAIEAAYPGMSVKWEEQV